MNYRSILVHLDDSARCAARIEIAARLAREHAAHLFGLAPSGLVNLPARVTPSFTGVPNYLDLAQASLNERAGALVRDYTQRLNEMRGCSHEARVDEDDTIPSLLRHAAVHDLVVVGQADRTSPSVAVEPDVAEQLVVHGGTPLLIVPYTGTFDTVGQSVVIAWNGTREAARAVRDALPMLRAARSVHLLCFERVSDLRHLARRELNDAQHWLGRHGVDVRVHQEPVRSDVGEVLLSRACDLGADLVVMGGYGHTRLTEFLLGGVTRRLLAQMTTPVLMSH